MNGGLSSTLMQAKRVKCRWEGTGEVSRGHALPSAIFANICKIYTWREQNLVAPSVPLSLLSPKCPPAPLLSSPTSVTSSCSRMLAPISCLGKGATALLPRSGDYGVPSSPSGRLHISACGMRINDPNEAIDGAAWGHGASARTWDGDHLSLWQYNIPRGRGGLWGGHFCWWRREGSL